MRRSRLFVCQEWTWSVWSQLAMCFEPKSVLWDRRIRLNKQLREQARTEGFVIPLACSWIGRWPMNNAIELDDMVDGRDVWWCLWWKSWGLQLSALSSRGSDHLGSIGSTYHKKIKIECPSLRHCDVIFTNPTWNNPIKLQFKYVISDRFEHSCTETVRKNMRFYRFYVLLIAN